MSDNCKVIAMRFFLSRTSSCFALCKGAHSTGDGWDLPSKGNSTFEPCVYPCRPCIAHVFSFLSFLLDSTGCPIHESVLKDANRNDRLTSRVYAIVVMARLRAPSNRSRNIFIVTKTRKIIKPRNS